MCNARLSQARCQFFSWRTPQHSRFLRQKFCYASTRGFLKTLRKKGLPKPSTILTIEVILCNKTEYYYQGESCLLSSGTFMRRLSFSVLVISYFVHSKTGTGLEWPHTYLTNTPGPINMVCFNVISNVSKLSRCFATLPANPHWTSCDLIHTPLQIGLDQCLQV